MTCCDTNLLIYAFDTSSKFHESSKAFIEECSQYRNRLCVTPQIILETYQVLTQKINHPYAPGKARKIAEEIHNNSNIYLAVPSFSIHIQAIKRATEKNRSGVVIFDYFLAATLIAHNVDTIATKNTKHFSSFPELIAIDPTI